MEKQVLVTGGCGYIGSFMVNALKSQGYVPIVIDNLTRGRRESISDDVAFYQGSVSDKELLRRITQEHNISGVIHFAGYISMKESMENPGLYFEQNTHETQMLLDNMNEFGVKNIIFSSTAGVYGNPERVPIKEDDRKIPTNPYGESKLMVERMLFWYQKVHGVSYVVLRYFNACGAMEDGSLGEGHSPETHIIPLALNSAKEGKEFVIYGNDYNTPDGTCVRDYIHVLDLAQAHILALEKIMDTPGGHIFNVGTGKGYSNKEIAKTIEEVTGVSLNVRFEGRRPGDADELVADVTKIKEELNFEAKNSDLHTIIKSAYTWHNREN